MVRIEDLDLEIYQEKLSDNWWDGRFNLINAEVVEQGDVIEKQIEANHYWLKECCAVFVGKNDRPVCDFIFFSEMKDGCYTPYPAFMVSPSRNRRYSKRRKCELYVDAKGYGANFSAGEVLCYSSLMLPPFKGQTGYCIGTIVRKICLTNNRQSIEIASPDVLCDNVKWQDLVKFAKPYDDYFAAARVEEVPSKSFINRGREYKAIPLYIGNRCVAVWLPNWYVDEYNSEYISYKEYMENF